MAIETARARQAPTAASVGGALRRDWEEVRKRAARRADTERLADGLGWLGIGVGLGLLAAPGATARLIGLSGGPLSRSLLGLVALREIATGVGIHGSRQPTGWLWGRVAGDVMDLALLGVALGARRPRRGRVMAAAVTVAGVTALDVLAARDLSRRDGDAWRRPAPHAAAARKSVTVNQPTESLYRYWRDFTTLPRFMSRLESVRMVGERRWHWKARGPVGLPLEWDSELVEERPGELIAWRSVPGGALEHSGSVRFRPAPGERGTTVSVEIEYTPPAGVLGAKIARLLGQAPEQQLQEDLRRFKQLMETGEIVVSEGVLLGAAQPVEPRPSSAAEAGRQR